MEEGRADFHRALVILGFHPVGARDPAAGVVDWTNLNTRNELQELDRLFYDPLSDRMAGVVVHHRDRDRPEVGPELAALMELPEILVDVDGVRGEMPRLL